MRGSVHLGFTGRRVSGARPQRASQTEVAKGMNQGRRPLHTHSALRGFGLGASAVSYSRTSFSSRTWPVSTLAAKATMYCGRGRQR